MNTTRAGANPDAAPSPVHAPLAAARGRRTLLLLVAVFSFPFLTALALYSSGWRPPSAAPHGRLLAEPTRLTWQTLQPVEGLSAARLDGRWALVLATRGACDAACAARLDSLRRIQVATNKHATRIARLWLVSDREVARTVTALPPDLVVAAPGDAAWADLLPLTGDRLLVVAPTGQAVLDYPNEFDARGVLRDLERLLKYSWSG